MRNGSKKGLSSVKNALLLLNCFSEDRPEWGVRELSRELNISHSTAQRLISTMSSEGYIVKNPSSNKYRLGTRLLGFGKIIKENLEIHSEALPILEKLVEKTGETVHVGVLEYSNLVYLHKVEPKRPIRVFTDIGKQAPSHSIAGGKAILAFQDSKTLDDIIEAGLHPYTDKTITEPNIFRKHLNKIANDGYAISQGEFLEEGEIISIAAPIFNYEGRAFASISLISVAQRLSDEKIKNYATMVKNTAKKISTNLGYGVIPSFLL